MGRLFAGTPWDRPPTCDRCGKPEPDCLCPPLAVEPVRLAPQGQTARIRLEKRPKGKVVTTIDGLDPQGNDLAALAAVLKAKCGTGGTVKEGSIEVQGDNLSKVEKTLAEIGYQVKKC